MDPRPSSTPAGRSRARLAALIVAVLPVACAAPPDTDIDSDEAPAVTARQTNLPDFVRRPYARFSRADAIAIALREWRAFGQHIDDDPPDARPPPAAEDKPERQPGLWERVGEYWWLGQNVQRREAAWTGKHDEYGSEFSAGRDGNFAWSAAFISYIMRTAGAGSRFPYSPTHATYINIARRMSLGTARGWVMVAEAPDVTPPQPGDLICFARNGKRIRFEDLPTRNQFPGHCDIVVASAGSILNVIGGNVDDTVTLKHVPTLPDGRLALPGGIPVDTRYPWMVVIRVLYNN
jgi:hypothetical protein